MEYLAMNLYLNLFLHFWRNESITAAPKTCAESPFIVQFSKGLNVSFTNREYDNSSIYYVVQISRCLLVTVLQ